MKKDKIANNFAQVGLLNIKEKLLLSVEKQANKISIFCMRAITAHPDCYKTIKNKNNCYTIIIAFVIFEV